MYVGFFAGWIGLWVVFGRANRVALGIVFVATLANFTLASSSTF